MNVTFNNSNIGNSQVGENNVMNLSGRILSDIEWKFLENEIEEALNKKFLKQKQKDMLKVSKEIVRDKNENGMKAFLKEKGMDFFVNTCSNILGNEAVKLLTRFF